MCVGPLDIEGVIREYEINEIIHADFSFMEKERCFKWKTGGYMTCAERENLLKKLSNAKGKIR